MQQVVFLILVASFAIIKNLKATSCILHQILSLANTYRDSSGGRSGCKAIAHCLQISAAEDIKGLFLAHVVSPSGVGNRAMFIEVLQRSWNDGGGTVT